MMFVDVTYTELVVRAQSSLDGAATLAEAAELARELADDLERLEQEGWELEAPIQDDWGFVHQVERPV